MADESISAKISKVTTPQRFGQNESVVLAQNNASSRAIKNITKMVIFQAFLEVTGTVPYIIWFIMNTAKLVPASRQFTDFSNISLVLLYSVSGFDIFIYYFFNKLYNEVLRGYLKKIFFFSNIFYINLLFKRPH